MAVTPQSFIAARPEFAKTQLSVIQAMLDEATTELDPTVWNALLDQGVSYLAAHKLALSPFGQNARMIAKDGTTTYWTHFQRLVRIVGGAHGGALVP